VCPVPLTVRVGGGDALRAACRAGDHIEIVKLLVSHGANARHQSVKEDEYDETTGNWRGPQEAAGSTPLYTAAFKRQRARHRCTRPPVTAVSPLWRFCSRPLPERTSTETPVIRLIFGARSTWPSVMVMRMSSRLLAAGGARHARPARSYDLYLGVPSHETVAPDAIEQTQVREERRWRRATGRSQHVLLQRGHQS